MHLPLPRPQICGSCSYQLFQLFTNGSAASTRVSQHGSRLWACNSPSKNLQPYIRSLRTARRPRTSLKKAKLSEDGKTNGKPETAEQMEAMAMHARKTFGDVLPPDFLTPDEYEIYERLYGPPLSFRIPEDFAEDFDLPRETSKVKGKVPKNMLMRENAEGDLEEVVYKDESSEDMSETGQDFDPRTVLSRDIAAAKAAELQGESEASRSAQAKPSAMESEENVISAEEAEEEDAESFEPEEDTERNGDSIRTHSLTAAGRFGTSPATVQIPKDTVVEPIETLLKDFSNKQLGDFAQKTFGGRGLPDSTATLTRAHLIQKPIALEASQSKMSEMEGNAYMAAIMPGAYATVMSTLVEVRKRLGHEWLRNLIQTPGGPRILDAGSGGAGVLAWREVLRAEGQTLHPGSSSIGQEISYGKSTVVTGSDALRTRASQLLDNTTFIPRLPDYNPSGDHPSLEQANPQPRKQYDIILAPYTLWTLKEDHMRKSQVQNLWSLLDPKGGVLILIEKGVPRGFELIASARETLLKYHVSSPGAEQVANTIEDASENRFGPKERGMIIAPCTNHGKCPMYIAAGKSQNRKDYCHFSQRYIRPSYLQRILDKQDRNHEDIRFSYIALQRGLDQREIKSFSQGQAAVEDAFSGYEGLGTESDSPDYLDHESGSHKSLISTLSLPRAILPPIKRRGHVTLDLCTPAGKIERWVVPKSFSKQAYRDARKSKWGDLWALGAKTRTERNLRVGLRKVKTQTKNIADAADDDEEDPRASYSRRGDPFGQPPKKDRNRRRIIEEDY